MTITEALVAPFRRPSLWIETWNWKTALLSAGVRAGIFFAINLSAGVGAALAAMKTEFLYRAIASGFYGGMTERLSRAEPARQATIAALIVLPGVAHVLEFGVHYAAGTAVLGASVLGSVAFSVLSTRFNLFAMQRGVLTVGRGRRSLGTDVVSLPGVIARFVLAGVRPALRLRRARAPRPSPCP